VAALADVVVFLAYGLGRGDREALAFAVLMLDDRFRLDG